MRELNIVELSLDLDTHFPTWPPFRRVVIILESRNDNSGNTS